jgi:hypothetical protein
VRRSTSGSGTLRWFDARARSRSGWRDRRQRCVSDVLATVLLVAIVMILVVVLFVLDSALIKGPGSTPIGTAFVAGHASPPSQCTATGAPTVGCIAGSDFVYTLTIEQSTVKFDNVLFEVKTPSGPIYRSTSVGGFNILNLAGQTTAAFNLSAPGAVAVPGDISWTYFSGTGVSSTTPLTSSYSIVIDVGSSSLAGQGYQFVVAGTNGYSGSSLPITLH